MRKRDASHPATVAVRITARADDKIFRHNRRNSSAGNEIANRPRTTPLTLVRECLRFRLQKDYVDLV